jgi:hypothetical protein
MNHQDIPLNEDFYIGENPKNLPHYSVLENKESDDFGEKLPEKYLNKFPEYFKIFCSPYIATDGSVKFKIQLSNEFLNAIKIHYNLKKVPSRQKLCEIIEHEVKECLKGF